MRIFSSVLFIFLCWLAPAQPLNSLSFSIVNTAYDELNPVLSPDGQTLYMTIANHPLNVGGKRDPGDIWVSQLSANLQWSEPVHGGPTLNHPGFNGVAGFSADGQDMFLLSHYNGQETPRTQGIAVTHRNGAGWSKPENISIPYFQNKSGILSGYVEPNQKFFVFSAETYGTRGVDDIYVSIRKEDGKWSEPKNLGSTINTQFQELSPSISVDGKTLYFSSNGKKGFGSFDVYSATRLDDSWTNWSDPVNLGQAVNSDGRELFYKDYNGKGFSLFTSTKNSDGYGDIKLYQTGTPSLPPDSVVQEVTSIVQATPDDGKIRVYGKVSNAKTGEAIIAKITFSNAEVNLPANANNGAGFDVRMPVEKHYAVKIEAPGYVSAFEKLETSAPDMKALEVNFKLQPVEIGTTVNLKNVLFEQGKTILLTESFEELDVVVSFLKTNPSVKIDLAGHTDNRGIPSQNLKLSQARVDKVKGYLVDKGIDRKRINGKGYGSAMPIASNESEETRQLNRRVEFTIKKL